MCGGRGWITSRTPRPWTATSSAPCWSPTEHALISLLALNGLRVSEATGADLEHLGVERGHRTLTITRKGGKVVTIPLAPRTARAIDLATGDRSDGPIFLAADGRRLDRHGAGRIVRRVACRAGIGKPVSRHTLRHAFITAALDAGVRYAICKRRPRMQIRGPRCDTTGRVAAWTGSLPMWSPPPRRGKDLHQRYAARDTLAISPPTPQKAPSC